MLSVLTFAGVALLSSATPLPEDAAVVYWWKFPQADCGYDDILQNCVGDSLETCQSKCASNMLCGGFNFPHGVMKKLNCLSKKAPSTTTLYIKESTPQPPPAVTIWPLPQNQSHGNTVISIDPGLKFSHTGDASPILDAAFGRYTKLMFPHSSTTAGALNSVTVKVTDYSEDYPQLEDDESYTLDIPSSGAAAAITAKTVYGALHALETLSQIIVFNFNSSSYEMNWAPLSIQDAPRFPHRGLMMDTARHFQSLRSIYKMVDSLPYSKINVLHWHMSDSQSFPMQSKTHPKLWDGAFSEVEKYTQADIAAVIEYARVRGIRTMVEFDMPGHAAAWCTGYPEICPSASCNQPLNLANNATFDLIEALLGEMTGGAPSAKGSPSGLFPFNMIHLGGDEVNTACWGKVPAIKAWLAAHNMTEDDGYAYFVKRVAQIAIDQGRRPVQWVEVFDHFGTKLNKKTIVHVWKSKDTLVGVTADGYQAIYNPSSGSDAWYLDHLTIDWAAAYGNEPCSDITDPKACALVLGGQGEMWGETVDASDIQQTVWPRLAAIGERLWSPRDQIADTQAAHPRLQAFRCLLNRRGIAAAPVDNGIARLAPPGPGSCLYQ